MFIKGWFLIQTISRQENGVSTFIKNASKAMNMDSFIFDIQVPVYSVQSGKKIKEEVLYPGYVYVYMILTPESECFINNLKKTNRKIIKFFPTPLLDNDIKSLKVKAS